MRHFLAALVLCLMAFPALAQPRSHHHPVRHHRHHHHHHARVHVVSLPPAERIRDPERYIGNTGWGLVTEAERHLGATGRIVGMARAWCGAFARLVVRGATGRDPGASFNLARNWAGLGSASAPRRGAIGVLPHHVGFVKAVEGGRVLLVSGNHGRRVAEGWYPIGRFIAFRAV